MNDCLHSLFAAWGEPSPEARAAHTDAAIGPYFFHADPNTPAPIEGRDAYLAYIAQFYEMMPGASAAVISVSSHNSHARATVDFSSGGKAMMRGQYFADLKDGRIVRLIGFAGTGEPE